MKPEAGSETDGEILAGLVEPAAPPAATRVRLLQAVEGRARYLPFSRLLARHFDLGLDEVDALLTRASDVSAWTRGVAPILRYLDFRPGPRAIAPRGGLIRLAAHGTIPGHRHVQPEVMVVLEGAIGDDGGRSARAGEALELPVDSSHTVRVDGPTDAVIALLHGKIHLLGT